MITDGVLELQNVRWNIDRITSDNDKLTEELRKLTAVQNANNELLEILRTVEQELLSRGL